MVWVLNPNTNSIAPEKITVTFYDQWSIEADEQEKVAGPRETVWFKTDKSLVPVTNGYA